VKISDSVCSEKSQKVHLETENWTNEDLEKCDVKALQQIEEER